MTLHAVRHRWMMVICIALAMPALLVVLDALRGGGYTAESRVRVQDLRGAETGEIPRQRLREIRDAVGAEEVSRSAMRSLGREGGMGEFNRSLEVEAGNEGRLNVAFSADSPEAAAEGANAYSRAFVDRVGSLNERRLAGGALNAEAELVRKARPLSMPAAGRPVVVALLAFIPGLAVGVAVALIYRGRDTHWRDVRDAELTLGALVLGVIPEYERGDLEDREGETLREQ